MNYGLQEVFMNKVLTDYFCGGYQLYVGLGLSNQGASENVDMFVEPIAIHCMRCGSVVSVGCC